MSYNKERIQPSLELTAEAGHNEFEVLENNDVDFAIQVNNISKCYQIYARPQDRLKQSIYPRLDRLVRRPSKIYYQEFWALKDVSFTVKKGETVGIIGKNGSGKSTLLQIICGTLNATSGTVKTNGRIAALLELGSGFNPEFTGRENVYMNGVLLGLSNEEIDARYDSIAAFADIGNFIEQPVKTYSSGMIVRLAFAVQAQVEPNIMIVDEALAVGDAKFQAKCFERLHQLKDNGTSILLVTHSSEQIVTHCSNAILLEDGMQLETGEPRRMVNRYMDLLFGKEKKSFESEAQGKSSDKLEALTGDAAYTLSKHDDVFSSRIGYNPYEYRWGDGTVSILDFHMAAGGDPYPTAVTSGQSICLGVSVKFYSDLLRPILGIVIKTKEGVTVYGVNSEFLKCTDFQVFFKKGETMHAEANFKCRLGPGDYFISLGIATRDGEEVVPHDRRYDAIHLVVSPHNQFIGLSDLDLTLSRVS
jgi:lipopolysaccharide transport system ATP-binding protein